MAFGVGIMNGVSWGVPIAVSGSSGPIYFCPELEVNGCMLISGPSGCGKSHFLTSMGGSLSEYCPVMAISPHDDFSRVTARGLLVTEEGIDGFGINPFGLSISSIQVFGVVGSANRIVSLLERFGGKFGVQQKAMIGSLLMDAARRKINPESAEVDGKEKFCIDDVVRLITEKKESSSDARERGILQSLLFRVSQVAALPIFTQENTIDPCILIQYSSIMDLSRIRGDTRLIIFDAILMMVQEYIFSLGSVSNRDKRFRLFVMVDEAKVFFGDKARRDDPEHPLNVIATEGRKYGIGLIVASQKVEHFSSDLIGSASLKMVMSPVCDVKEKRRLSSEFDISSSELRLLSSPGWAFVSGARVQPGIYRPVYPVQTIQRLPILLQSALAT
jgi:DNA helicase HerA-like ATPase